MPELSERQRRELDALRQAYEAELPQKVTAIAQAAAALGPTGWETAGVHELRQLVHRLAGSSAIWGFTQVSRAAGELEELVLSRLDGSRGQTDDLSREVRRLVQDLERAVSKRQADP